MDSHEEARQDDEMAAFVQSLRSVWRNQTWQAVEPFARRAWHQRKNNRCWEEVRERVRRIWVAAE